MSVNRVAEGLTVVTVGMILLGNTTGYLPWSVWLTILSLWPLLIVSVGIEILGKSIGSEWLRAASSVVVIGGLVAGALVLPGGSDSWYPGWGLTSRQGTPFEFVAEHDPRVETGFVRIDSGAGDVTVGDGSDLAESSGSSVWEDPEMRVDRDGDHVTVDVSTGSGTSRGAAQLDVELDRDVAWELEVDIGASQLDMDLSELEVTSVMVSTGAADLDITFGDRARQSFATIRSGVSHVVLRVPEDMPFQIRSRVGLGGHDMPAELERQDDGDGRLWRTPDFEGSRRYLDVDLEVGISSVEVVYY